MAEHPPRDPSKTRVYHDFLVSSKLLVRIAESAWQPPTDVFETEDDVLVRIEVAGVDATQVALTIEGNRLTVRGRRDEPRCEKRRAFRQMEIHYGPFEREIWVEGPVDALRARAAYANGFLEVVLPKARRGRTGRIEVRIG